MLHEIVRPGTFSRGLTMQLLVGNAVEILLLMQAGAVVDQADLDALRRTADQLTAGGGIDEPVVSSAVSDDSIEMVTAARAALEPSTMDALKNQLRSLAKALRLVADQGNLCNLALPVDDLIEQLSAIRQVLSARTAVAPDEVRGLSTH